ncbi:MAG: recombinase family protein [Pirellulales bacterium]
MATTVRCAIYTRKSTEEGLERDFNSLDAQREAAEAYIKSQAGEGWQALPEIYDDGGFTGGNMERPALQRLLEDVRSGRVQVVVVYKVDRLSRSLLDFARMMEVFERHQVSFVSVTQQFNTATSMGRLVLNVLLSFAQFEREIISERTRDKIAATRRKGKWAGGLPILGYDVDHRIPELVVNEEEAQRVREVFAIYLQQRTLLATVHALAQRGWRNKRWTTRKGIERGGKPFTKTSLYALLTNVTYHGKTRYKDELHLGQHAAIVCAETWREVQDTLAGNRLRGRGPSGEAFPAPLKGILRCCVCQAAMTPTHTTRGNRRYRYYVCSSAQKLGWDTCPSKAVPAGQIERFVLARLAELGQRPEMLRHVPANDRATFQSRLARLVENWDQLSAARRGRVLQQLIQQVDYDGGQGTAAVTFSTTGLESLSDELAKIFAEKLP